MTVGRRSADIAGLIGWVYTSLIAVFVFHTSWSVILIASIAGIIASFPISLMVVTSIFQINVMEEAGAIRRIVVFMKTLASENRAVQIMLINVGVGTLLASLGATPVSILPPIMLSLGYSSFAAIALPAIGYDALCTYALLGIPVVVFADVASGVTGQPFTPAEVGLYFAQYMPFVTTFIALSMLWLAGGWAEMKRGWLVALITGVSAGLIAIGVNMAGLPTLTGVVAGIGVVLIMLLYLKISGKPIIDRSKMTPGDKDCEGGMRFPLAVLPWILLIVFSVFTNYDKIGLYDILFKDLSMPISIIPGGKPILMRVLWQAYFWVLVATLLAIPFYKMTRTQVSSSFRKFLRRAPRPAFAAAIFFAIAYVLNNSGKAPGMVDGVSTWVSTGDANNMVKVIALASANLFQNAYGGIAPFLGLLGGFISGSETSSIVMMTKLHYETSLNIYTSSDGSVLLKTALLIAAASGIGGGLASVISPAKLQNASAVIDKIGMESKVIRATIVISLIMTLGVAILTFFFLR